MVLVACSDRREPRAVAENGSAAGPPPALGPIAADYKSDIENLCDVMKRSGADQLSPSEQQPAIAMWLGPNIKSDQGHKFLVSIAPLQGMDKAKALEDEAARVGIANCPLAAEWKKPGAANTP